MRTLIYTMEKYSGMLYKLCKVRLAFLVTCSMAVGYVLARGTISPDLMILATGIFLLACGGAALNQVQEHRIDRIMNRTRSRPIPAGEINVGSAFYLAMALITGSLVIIYLGSGIYATGLSVFAIVWYNLVYTSLKKKSAFAVIPGALTGVVPPMIGWIAAGGDLNNPKIIGLMFFFFIWQVPHFWLLVLSYGEDYKKAGLPSLTSVFTVEQLTRITFIWILATAEACMFILLFGFVKSAVISIGIIGLTFWLVLQAIGMLRSHGNEVPLMIIFRGINVYAAVILLFLTIDTLTL
jgi:protoheme IX farnesyltransferase